jgi:hypothetical protein
VQGKPDYEYVRARYDNEAGKGWVFHRPHWKKRQHSGEQASKPAT